MNASSLPVNSSDVGQVPFNFSDIPLLAGVEQETLSLLAPQLRFIKIKKHNVVIEVDSPGDQLMFLISGRLQVVDVTEDGRRVGLSFLAPGEYFGELSIIDNLRRSASVVACEDSLIASLPRGPALMLFYHTPLIAERIMRRLAYKLRSSGQYRNILGIPNASQRVFALLNRFTVVAPGGLVLIEKMPSQQEIAIMVNTSRETVSRSIQALIVRGVVEKDLRRLIVRRPDELKRAVSLGLAGAPERETAS